jgi:hypothetical protein
MNTAAQTRKLLIGMALRRQNRGFGSRPEFVRERTARLRFPDLTSILAGVPWAITGAAGTRLYMPERMTRDLDILVSKDDSLLVQQRFDEAGAEYKGALSIGGRSWSLTNGFPVDVIESDEAWVVDALRAARHNLDPQGMPVLPLEYQVLMKFRASRVQDLADISRMLGQATDDQLEATRNVFTQWAPKDMDDLESLIALGRLETEGLNV